MKEVIHNSNNLTDSEITEIVIRTKALIVNKNNILIADENDVYQFPGGHLEENETLKDCLKREILEETGIMVEEKEIGECILKVSHINKDWPSINKNRKCEVYYYVINTEKYPDINKCSLTINEKEKNYKVQFIPLKDSIKFLENCISKNEKNCVIIPDMIVAIKEFLKKI